MVSNMSIVFEASYLEGELDWGVVPSCNSYSYSVGCDGMSLEQNVTLS